MLILYFFIIPALYIPLKLILCFLTTKYGYLSYKDFNAFGFKYNSNDGTFYSSKDAWQKYFGYCYFYDVCAPLTRIIIDTERVKFNYNNKNWLISFWKGQYGIATGAEIGTYYTNEMIINKKTLYLPVKEKDLLDISYTLYKNNEPLCSMSDKHWWLTSFKLGMFSKPKNLKMDISIKFPNEEMLQAFLKGFKKLKYRKKNYEINDTTFKFTFNKPHTRKVWTRNILIDWIRQHFNKKNASLYSNYMADLLDDAPDEKTILINDFIPDIVKNKDIK